MRPRYVHYDLEHGFIDNWLVAGPQEIAVEAGQFQGENTRAQIAQDFYESDSGITQTPVERGPLDKGLFQVGDYSGSWHYYACREDHLVEHSGIYPTLHYLRSWAFTQLDSKTERDVSLMLFAHGPADVWVNGQHVQRQERFYGQQPGSVAFNVSLKKGVNKILVRFEAVAMRECPHALALRVCKIDGGQPCQPAEGIRVSLPT
jgi:hypothetical protein